VRLPLAIAVCLILAGGALIVQAMTDSPLAAIAGLVLLLLVVVLRSAYVGDLQWFNRRR